jgi:hypothetical protein
MIFEINNPELIKVIEAGTPLGRLEKIMKPAAYSEWGQASAFGFLGADESLVEVIVSDAKILEKYGLSHKEVADALEKIDRSYSGYATTADIAFRKEVTRRFSIVDEMTCGEQPCPWSDRQYDNAFYMIWFNPKNSEHTEFIENWKSHGLPRTVDKFKSQFRGEPVMIVSGIMPHLIRDHYFFQGKGTPYRVDPEQFVRWVGPQNIKNVKG